MGSPRDDAFDAVAQYVTNLPYSYCIACFSHVNSQTTLSCKLGTVMHKLAFFSTAKNYRTAATTTTTTVTTTTTITSFVDVLVGR